VIFSFFHTEIPNTTNSWLSDTTTLSCASWATVFVATAAGWPDGCFLGPVGRRAIRRMNLTTPPRMRPPLTKRPANMPYRSSQVQRSGGVGILLFHPFCDVKRDPLRDLSIQEQVDLVGTVARQYRVPQVNHGDLIPARTHVHGVLKVNERFFFL